MPEVLLSNDSLTVLGGPSSLNIELDVGPAGKRGSIILLSNGDPNISGNISQVPSLLDLAININNLDADYRTVYQYLSVDGSNTWTKVTDLRNGIFAAKLSATFTGGLATISVPVSSIIDIESIGPITSEDFAIFVSPAVESVANNFIFLSGSVNYVPISGTDPTLSIDITGYRGVISNPVMTFEPLDELSSFYVSIQLVNYKQ